MEEEIFVDSDGIPLSGEELENYCRKHGLCHLCARVKTHKRVFKLLKKNKWQPLTAKNHDGEYIVYKGYCVQPGCFTLDQAMRLLGEGGPATTSTPTRERKRIPFHERLKRGSSGGSHHKGHSSDEENGKDYRSGLVRTSSESDVSVSSDIIRRNDDDVSVGSTMTSDTSVRRGLTQLLQDNAGTVLDLSSTRLHLVHINELVSSFKVAQTLTTLILENCKLNDNELEIITQGLCESKHIPLTRFSLRTNLIGNRGASSMYEWLHLNETIEGLDLSKNRIGSKGANTVIAAFRDNQKTRIRMLNFAHNEIWDPDDGSFFQTNKTLKVLNLEGNFIHDEGVEAMAQGIAANENTALERLFLGWNGLGDDGAIALAKMLEVNKTLKTLGLGENDITSTGARALLSALALNKTLREISGLYHNQIDRKFIIAAIKRLLQTHIDESIAFSNPQKRLTEILEESVSNIEAFEDPVDDGHGPEPSSESSLNWEDKLFAPGEDARPPILEINTGPSSDFDSTLHHKDCSCDSCIQKELRKSQTLINQNGERRASFSSPKNVPQAVKSAAVEALKKWDWGTMGSERADDDPVYIASVIPPPQTNFDRMAAFHSAPLAYFNRETTLHHAVPLHDFDFETQVLRSALKESEKNGGRIDLEIGAGTIESLKSFFTKPTCRVLHISGHGHPEMLALENGLGYIDSLPVDELTRMASLASDDVKLVFVTSCHSRLIGKALVDAGIPHVVCCHHAETFRDRAAIAFTQNFYRSLGRNKSLKQAFETAQEAVRVEEISKHVDRFVLLPKKDHNDPYHDVPIFFTKPVPPSIQDDDEQEALKLLPELPQYFMGREVDMYEILEALRVDDVVRIGGAPGTGKTTVAAAVARYILRRRKSFLFDDIFWLPPIKGVVPDPDSLYGDLCESVATMINSSSDIWQGDSAMECRERIEIELEGRRTVLVIDGRAFRTEPSTQNLEHFLSHLLNVVGVKIILITGEHAESSSLPQEEDTTRLGPLDFKSTALLFGEVSRFITTTGCPAAQTPEEFASLMVPPSVAKLQDQSKFTSRRRSELMAYIGNGIPVDVISAATRMTADRFITMIGIANTPEVHVASYSAVQAAISKWSMQKKMAINSKNYLRAKDLEKLLEELQNLKSKFPSLDDLIKKEKQLQNDLTTALRSKQYEVGNGIKRQILALKRQIMQEKRTAPSQKEQTAGADTRLMELQDKMKSMLAMADQSLSDLDHDPADTASAVFAIGSSYHRCMLHIYCAPIIDYDPSPDAGAIVCWTNECCDLKIEASGRQLLDNGGANLSKDVKSLPPIAKTEWGLAKCGTGNACIVGPGDYRYLRVPCIALAVGPLCPSCEDDCEIDDEDLLHYISIMMRSCVRSSLVLAKHSQLQSIAFPTLTTRFGGETYDVTLRMGLRTFVEEAKYSDLSSLHIVASSDDEASKLISMASKMGLQYA